MELMKCLKYLVGEERREGRLVVRLKVWEDIVGMFEMEVGGIEY